MSIPIYYIVKIQYPNVTIGYNCQVELVDHGDGNGVQIGVWNVPNVAQPTIQELEALSLDLNVAASYQALLNEVENQPIIAQLDSLDLKSIRAIRENNAAKVAQWDAEADILRAQLLPMTAAGVLAAQNKGS